MEDNIFQAKKMEDIVLDLICQGESNNPKEKLKTFYKPSSLLAEVNASSESYNLYFLDLKIKMDETAGFLTARHIRENERNSLICFVTSYSELALTSYDYGLSAYAFIVKDAPKLTFLDQIRNCIRAYRDNTPSKNEDLFTFESKHIKVICPFRELLFITPVSAHKLLIKTTSKEIYAHGSLKDFNLMDDRLIRCHQSFMVNITNIKYVDKTLREAVIDDSISIPISRKRTRELKIALENYWNK